MKILETAIAYAIFIVSVVWLFIYVLSLISEFLRFVDKRYPKVWVLGGISLVFLGVMFDSAALTVMALLCAIMGMLIVAIGGLVWWQDWHQVLEHPEPSNSTSTQR